VVADIVSLARNIAHGVTNRVPVPPYAAKKMPAIKITPVKETVSRYYLRFSAIDKPGVLSKISGILGRNSISIYSVVQKGRHILGGMVRIFMLTHEAKEADLQKALKEIDRLAMMKNKTMVIRIEDSEL
jgi:homoserine dehydrogenase